ncbi:MAG: AbgT family transporter [Bacilli bacterium]
MTTKQKNKKCKKSLIFSSLIISMTLVIVTALLAIIGFEGQKTSIVSGGLETSLITIKNIFSLKGIQYFFNNLINNFSNFEPLLVMLISLVGIGVAEISGLFKAFFSKFRNIKFNKIIVFTLFFSIISGIFGEYSFAIVLPLVAVFYKNIGKNPVIGLIVAFFGLTIGQGACLIFSYDNYLLGNLTQTAARVEVDKNYTYNMISTLYISLGSMIVIIFAGFVIINKMLLPKFTKSYNIIEENDEIIESRQAKKYSLIAFGIIVLLIAYAIIPGLPWSGWLLNTSEEQYIAQLFGYDSPFRNAFVFIIALIFIVCGYIYGKASKNIKDNKVYTDSLSNVFDGLGLMFILSFIFSQLIAIMKWTGIGEVIAANLMDVLARLQLSGIPLIILFILFTIIISLFIPSVLDKWILISPLIVPLFMRANIAPEFTQFIYGVSSGIGRALTPLFGYFIILIALLRKYNNRNGQFDAFSKFYKTILPVVITFILLWMLIIISWYISGLPIGIGGLATL